MDLKTQEGDLDASLMLCPIVVTTEMEKNQSEIDGHCLISSSEEDVV